VCSGLANIQEKRNGLIVNKTKKEINLLDVQNVNLFAIVIKFVKKDIG
jgi:DUF971 family protein